MYHLIALRRRCRDATCRRKVVSDTMSNPSLDTIYTPVPFQSFHCKRAIAASYFTGVTREASNTLTPLTMGNKGKKQKCKKTTIILTLNVFACRRTKERAKISRIANELQTRVSPFFSVHIFRYPPQKWTIIRRKI